MREIRIAGDKQATNHRNYTFQTVNPGNCPDMKFLDTSHAMISDIFSMRMLKPEDNRVMVRKNKE